MKVFFVVAIVAAIGWYQIFWVGRDTRESFGLSEGKIQVSVNGQNYFFIQTGEDGSETVKQFLMKHGFNTKPEDEILPDRDAIILPGMTIFYTPAREILIKADKTMKRLLTVEKTVADILESAEITLDQDDIVEPRREMVVSDGTQITVIRVEVKEEYKDSPIAFIVKTIEDDKLSWRQRVVKQKGVNGVKRTTYRISYHDGKEINRRSVKTEMVKEPIEEVIIQGTLVKTGKTHRGAASWYAHTGTMAAANPWLPLGSYVRVTNLDNGKSVIVKINDRGPFVPGRIIDLDKVAFAKIASLSTGVINVKMEEITN